MTRHNLAQTLPPGDRDDAPSFDLGEAIRDTPLLQDELPSAPTLTDPTTISRLTRLGRHTTEGSKYVMEALRLLAEGHYADAHTAIRLASEHLTDAASLSRRLADLRTSRAITKE